MGAKERMDKLIEVQDKGYDGVLEYLKFCEADKKKEPMQSFSTTEVVERKPATQDEIYWRLIDKRLAKNGIRI